MEARLTTRPLLRVLCGLLLLALGSAASAAADTADPDGRIARHLRHDPRLLGDPGGVRSRLEQLGIGIQLFYNQYLSAKPGGGGIDPDTVLGYSGSYDWLTRIDFETLLGWRGLELMLQVRGLYGRDINAAVGALSNPIDDADFDEPIYVDQLWLQQSIWRDRIRLRLGFLEQQTLFDRNAYANSEDRQFLSTFLDNNAVVPLPNGLGAALILAPTPRVELALGAADADNIPRRSGFDTAFDDVDGITGYLELKLVTSWQGPSGRLPGAYRIGAFLDGRELEVFGRIDPRTGQPERARGHPGAYVSFDQRVYREGAQVDEGLGVFARFGWADPDVNRLAWFWSIGMQYQGLIPSRGNDVFGLAIYQAIGSQRYRDEVDSDFESETGLEIYFRWMALPWLAVTPDFQYIFDPGATGVADDAAVLTLRFRVTF